jgi:hypothetical protein
MWLTSATLGLSLVSRMQVGETYETHVVTGVDFTPFRQRHMMDG